MEKRMAQLQENQVNLKKDMAIKLLKLEKNTTDIEETLEVVNNEVKGLKTALVGAFDQMKDVLVKMEEKMEENARKVRNAPSGDRENIIVAGGLGNDSEEMFNWRQRTWSPLQSIPKNRYGATSFVYNNQVVVAGGYCSGGSRYVDDMIRMNVDPLPDLAVQWSEFPVKLPAKLIYHCSVMHDDKLMVTGGDDGNTISDKIYDVQVAPPYTMKSLSRMPEPRQRHCTEIFDDSLLIYGGTKTG